MNNLKIYENSNYDGELWLRDANDNIFPLNQALSSIYLKYENFEQFYFQLNSNKIKNFDIFYDCIFIQAENLDYIFDKYYVNQSGIVPYNKIKNYKQSFSNLDIDYWFDEESKSVFIFEFEDIPVIQPSGNYSLIQYKFNFKKFDTKTNVIENLITEKIYFWLYKPNNMSADNNGVKENPKLTYNKETNTFNVSFIVKNNVFDNSLKGIISMNLKQNKILEINAHIPFGIIMPLGFQPPLFDTDIPLLPCNNINVDGEQGYNQYYIDFGNNIGPVGISYNSFNLPDKFELYWNNNIYSTGYVGNNQYDEDLLALGISPDEINTGNPSTGSGELIFQKTSVYPSYATIRVFAPLGGTGWEIGGICSFVGTPTPTPTQTKTPTPTPTLTPTKSLTPTPTQTGTQTPTPTQTPTQTKTSTPTKSLTPTPTTTLSLTPTNTPTQSVTPTNTPTPTLTPITSTPTPTISTTPTNTPTPTPTPTIPAEPQMQSIYVSFE